MTATPTEATFHFPGGLADYLRETLNGTTTYSENPFAVSLIFKAFSNTRQGGMGHQLDPFAMVHSVLL